MNYSLLVGLTFALIGLSVFTAQVVVEGARSIFRRESQAFAFARVENVYPKFKL